MLRDTLVATLAALVVVAGFLVREAVPPETRPAPDERTRGSLDYVIQGRHQFVGTVRQAVEWLEFRGAAILVEWPQNDAPLDSWRIPARARVNLSLRDATVEQWLTAIEVQSRGSLCHYLETDGTIRLTTVQAQKPPLVSCVYDVRDLLAEARSVAAMFPVPAASSPDGTLWGAYSQEAITSGLDEWVQRSVRDWNWEYVGSGGLPAFGKVGFLDGRMTVLQTPQAQREIAATLAALRARRQNPTWRGGP